MNTLFDANDHPSSGICWGAVIAGVVVALMIQFLWNLLGMGLGLSVFTLDMDTIKTLSTSSIIWLVATGVTSMFAGGWVAGKYGAANELCAGALHGLLMWAVAGLFVLIVATTTTGMLVGKTFALMGDTISLVVKGAASVGKGAAQAVPALGKAAQQVIPNFGPAVQEVTDQAQSILAQNQQPSAQQLKNQLGRLLKRLFAAANDQDTAAARQATIDFLVKNAHVDQQKAEQTVDKWASQYNELKDQISEKAEDAKQAVVKGAEKTSRVLAKFAYIGFLVSLTGALAALYGGLVGVQRRRAPLKSNNEINPSL